MTIASEGRVRSSALVGRRLELSWLRRRFQLALQGYAHLVLVEGEAGIGKTRLVLEVLEEARQASATVVRGRCYQHLNLAYLPLRESLFPALEQAIAGEGEQTSDQAFLQRLSADAQDTGAGGEADMATRSRQLLNLTRLVVDCAKQTPMVVFIDDLDWADDATLDLLRHLLFRFEDESPALLLLATTRLDPRARAADGVAKLHADLRSATLSLHPLSAMEATELARERRPGISVEDARQLAVASGGNPLLIDALARWSPTAEIAAEALTSTGHPMVSAIEARLHALDASTRELVRVAALLVPDNTPSTLAGATGMEPAVLRRARNEAIEHGVFVEDGASVVFAHPLYAHVTRAETPAPTRRVIHARIASVLLARSHEHDAVSVREVAHHLAEAGEEAEPAIVAEYASRAGDEAMAIAAWGEAARHYEAAISAAGADLDATALSALHRLAGLSLRGNLELKRAVAHFDAAIESLGSDADEETVAELEMWRVRCGVGTQELLDVVKNRARLESLVESVEQRNPALAAEVLVELSQSYWVDGRMDESEAAARRAMAVAASCGSHAARARGATSLSVPQWSRYDVRESLESLEEGAAEAALSDEGLSRAGGAAFRIPLALAWLGRLDEAESRAHECCAVAERVQYPLEEGLPLAALALVAATRGEFDRVEQLAHRALLVQQLSGYHWAAGLFLPTLFSACLARGRYDAARDALDTWSDSADLMGLSTIALFQRYATALERRIPTEGERLPSLPRTPMVGADTWAAVHVELARREGAGAHARRARDLLVQIEQRGGLVVGGLGYLVPRLRGVAADLLDDEDEALATLERALTTAEQLRAEPEYARALADLAVILLRRGERREANAKLDDACARFERLGMSPDVERASRMGGDGVLPMAGRQAGTAPPPAASATARAVILFSDVVESTRHTEELGTARYRERARQMEELVTAAVAAHGGTIVSGINLGDGFIGLFPSIESGLAAARQCAGGTSSTGLHLHLALHSGEIVVDGQRIYGSPVNYAARLCGITGPDEILVSDTIRERATALPNVAFLDRGEHTFKGFAGPQRVYALVEPDTSEAIDS